jgi:DNA-binding XRE family transcriptional regulator
MKNERLEKWLAAYPNGRAIVATFLMHWEKPKPLREWTTEDFAVFRRGLRKNINIMRDEFGASDKAFRKTIKTQEDEAVKYWEKLTRDIEATKTRETTLHYLEIWEENAKNGNWSPNIAQKFLENLLRSDHLHIESGEVSRAILEGLQNKEHIAKNGNEFPFIEGVARRGDGSLEKYTHHLMPVTVAEARETRSKTLRETDLLPEELDGIYKVPDFDQREYEATLKYQASLTDIDSDLLAYLFAVFCEKAKHQDDVVSVTLNQIMGALHFHFHVSGVGTKTYRKDDRQWIRERVGALRNQFLTISRSYHKGQNKRPLSIESAVLKIDKFGGQEDLSGRVLEWTDISYGFGRAWSYRLFEGDYGRQLAIFEAAALKYHPEREKAEKRLLKRLSWYWRLNSKSTKPYTRKIREMLNEDIVVDSILTLGKENALKIEQALRTLKTNGHIGDWYYVGGETEISKIDGRLPNNWLDGWLNREVAITAPVNIVLAYQRELGITMPVLIEDSDKTPFGKRIKQFRAEFDIKASTMAAAIGIAKTTLSSIESGRRPAGKHQEALSRYMDKKRNALKTFQEVLANRKKT